MESNLKANRWMGDGSALCVSAYDRWNARLVVSILLCGFLVMVWLLQVWHGGPRLSSAAPAIMVDSSGNEKDALDSVAPEWLDADQFPEAQIEPLAGILEAVVDVSATLARQGGWGQESGLGSRGRQGKPRKNDPGPYEPAAQRWQLDFRVPDLDTYARLLSHFGIEIGLVHQSLDDVWRLADPAGAQRVERSTRADENRRRAVFFGHRLRQLEAWDAALLQRAGVKDREDHLIVQFVSPEFVKQLEKLEIDHARSQGHELDHVSMTRFGLRVHGQRFELSVLEQRYRGN